MGHQQRIRTVRLSEDERHFETLDGAALSQNNYYRIKPGSVRARLVHELIDGCGKNRLSGMTGFGVKMLFAVGPSAFGHHAFRLGVDGCLIRAFRGPARKPSRRIVARIAGLSGTNYYYNAVSQ